MSHEPSDRRGKKVARDKERKQERLEKKKRKNAEGVAPEAGAEGRQQADGQEAFAPLAIDNAATTEPATEGKKAKSKKRKQREDEVDGATEGDAAKSADAAAGNVSLKPKKRLKKNTTQTNEVAVEATEASGKPKGQKKTTAAAEGGDGEAKETGEGTKKSKDRFIVFVGNLPFNTTDASLQAHFQKLQPFTLRHRTDPKTKKSKGFSFLEFENYDRMKTCLKLYHHSMFDPDEYAPNGGAKGKGRGGRQMNVELTAGGGGKTEGRMEKIKVKNVRLEEQRQRRAELERKEKEKAEGKGGKVKKPEAAKGEAAEVDTGVMHPSRLARLNG